MILKMEQLSVSYQKNLILDEIGFSLKPHTFTAVLGKNGCGKSTLVSCINQELRYTGKICYRNENLALMHSRERAKAIAVLPQILEKPHVTVEEFVMFGRTPYLNFYQKPSEEDVQAVQQAMKDAGVEGLRNKMVDCLSGGERQKAYIAMILAQQTKLIILDEPTTYMDMENETAFLNLLTKLKKNHKKTLLVIMHNLAQAVRYADHILVLDKQRIVFDGTKEECLQSDILEQVFHVKKHIFMEEGTRYVFFDA